MNELGKAKAFFIMVGTAIWARLGVLAIPWLVLLLLNLIDYATGIEAAAYRNPEDKKPVKSRIALRGIQKKVCMHGLVVIGRLIDWIIKASIVNAGWGIPYPPVFAITIALWLTFNEIISILENMEDIGTPIPPFLKPIMKMMRTKVNDHMEQLGGEQDE